jgi:hypothetical protein
MSQGFSRRPPHRGARASSCKVCVGQSGTGTGFSPNGLTNSIETDIVGIVCKIRDVQMNIERIAL